MSRAGEAPWLFRPLRQEPEPEWIVDWWEARRLTFNAIVLPIGLVSFALTALLASQPGLLPPGEDVADPLALFAAPFAINAIYTLVGWMAPYPPPGSSVAVDPDLGPRLMRRWLRVFIVVLLLPPAIWLVRWLLRAVW